LGETDLLAESNQWGLLSDARRTSFSLFIWLVSDADLLCWLVGGCWWLIYSEKSIVRLLASD
jgi:hypothetical protein